MGSGGDEGGWGERRIWAFEDTRVVVVVVVVVMKGWGGSDNGGLGCGRRFRGWRVLVGGG